MSARISPVLTRHPNVTADPFRGRPASSATLASSAGGPSVANGGVSGSHSHRMALRNSMSGAFRRHMRVYVAWPAPRGLRHASKSTNACYLSHLFGRSSDVRDTSVCYMCMCSSAHGLVARLAGAPQLRPRLAVARAGRNAVSQWARKPPHPSLSHYHSLSLSLALALVGRGVHVVACCP